MKILVLSLLRAGDLVMQRPLFAAIKEQSKDCELHILINDEVSWIAPILKEVDHVHIFPRKLLQNLIGEANHNIFRASLELSNFLLKFNEQNFDEVMNFTHNRLSAYVAEEVSAPIKRGLFTEGPRFHGMENKWLKLFNDRFSGSQPFSFHYTEILAQSFNLKIKPPAAPEKRNIERIFFQVLTSDTKKNWSLTSYRNLLDELYGAYPKISFKILASENEKSFLQKYFESEEICTWDMVTLEKEFSSRDLLITGDTVTMHLAAQKSAQIIEIALGSSDPWKTGPWASDHYILTSKVACYPCVHSSSCRQISHLCSEPISPKIIKSVIDNLIEKKPILGSITGPLRVLKSQVADYGYELVSENSAKDLRVLNKILWQKIMDPGTEISSLDSLNFGFTVRGIQDLQAEMNEILYILQMDFENLVQRLGADNLRLSDVQEARRKMGSLSAAEANQEWVWMFKDLAQLSFTTPLHFLSAYQDRLEILKGAIFYRNEMMAKPTEGFNESGSRTVPKNSLAEA